MTETRLTWLGHSTFLVETSSGQRILIEPWLSGNPRCPERFHELFDLDLILCTHGHDDHIGDVFETARRNPAARIVGMVELCQHLNVVGIPESQLAPMNKGGTQRFDDISVTMVTALHSSSTAGADGEPLYLGEAAGFVVGLPDGHSIYHAGDTCVFGDMKLIGELYSPTLALLPIGGHFTMDPVEAACAVRLLGVSEVVGMHYGTFPVLTGRPDDLVRELDGDARVIEVEAGETLSLSPAHA